MTFKLQSNWRLNRVVYLRHLLVWVLFFIYENGSLYLATGTYAHVQEYLLFYSLNIALFYLNTFYVLPAGFDHPSRSPWYSPIFILGEIAIYLSIKFMLDRYLYHLRHPDNGNLLFSAKYLAFNLWRGLFFMGISTLYWSVWRTVRYQATVNQAEKRELELLVSQETLEKDLAVIHNAYLQQQINPHFLFSTLTFIYNSFYKISAPAALCVSKLADILRYSFQPTGEDGKTYLRDEVEQINNFIELNQQRFRFPIFIQTEISGHLNDLRLLPLTLLSYVENMFKHGNLKEEHNPALITIHVKDKHLHFYCRNLKKSEIVPSGRENIGLSNTVKRLGYTYPDNYQLQVVNGSEFFEVDLQINL